MAHLRELIDNKCWEPYCKSTPKVQLFGSKNEPFGQYCRKHGAQRERILTKQEQVEFNRVTP